MCMARIDGKFPISAEEGRLYGYKVFRIRRGRLYGEFCGRSRVRPSGEWLNASDFDSKSGWFPTAARIEQYEPGWHVFRTRAGANRWRSDVVNKVVVKVLVRKVREKGKVFAGGVGMHKDCFVCDEMFIPMEV